MKILFSILLLYISTVLAQHPSPCPEVFNYVKSQSKPGSWVGELTLNSEFPLSGVWIRVALDKKVDFQTQFGEAIPREEKEYLIRNPDYNLIPDEPLKITFSVHFPPDEPIPSLTGVRMNGRVVCPPKEENPVTKCPGVFTYNPGKVEDNVWQGTLTLESEFELKGVWIRIVLDNPAELLVNEFGEITTKDNISYLIKNPNHNLAPGHSLRLQFWVRYSPAAAIPSIKTVRLNGRTVCGQIVSEDNNNKIIQLKQIKHIFTSSEEEIPGEIWRENVSNLRPQTNEAQQEVPTIPALVGRVQSTPQPSTTLTTTPTTVGTKSSIIFSATTNSTLPSEKTLSTTLPSATTTSSITTSTTKVPSTTTPTTTPESSTELDTSHNHYISCGTVVPESLNLIIRGEKAQNAQWPWHGAIYISRPTSLDYICGTSLITERHSLTAAHCVIENLTTKTLRDPSTLILYFGLLNRKVFTASTVQRPQPSKITIHPDYSNSGGDIAVIKFEKPVKFTNWVRPVCLWEGETDLRYIVNQTGTVVGFGVTETEAVSDDLLYADILVADTPTCIFSNRDFYSKYTSPTTFCAGNLTQSAVCNGDSGGGMVFKRDGTDIYQIRGIVSTAVRNSENGLCDYKFYAIFTDTTHYVNWIEKVLTE